MIEGDVLPRAIRVAGAVAFVDRVGTLATAEFIVDMMDVVSGLNRNNAAMLAAFGEPVPAERS